MTTEQTTRQAIGEAVSGDALAWWNGASDNLMNELEIYADRHGIDAAIKEIEELAVVEES